MRVTLGRRSDIASTGSDIDAVVTVGNFTQVASHVSFLSRVNHACIAHPELVAAYQMPGYPPPDQIERITIGSDVWIGRNAVLLGGITVGHGAIVGAFAVVAKDVPPYAIVVGNPCRILRYRFGPKQIAHLLALKWWDWDDETIRERRDDLKRIDVLLAKYTDFGGRT